MGFGMGSSSGSSVSEPWADLQPYLSGGNIGGTGETASSGGEVLSWTQGYDESGNPTMTPTYSTDSTSTSGSAEESFPGLYNMAADWYNQNANPTYYEGDTVAGITPATQSAWDAISQRATQGSPVTNSAQSNVTNTLSGDYLYSNPSMSYYNELAGDKTLASNPAYGLLMNTAQGGYLNANPYIDDAYTTAAESVTNEYLDTTFPTIQSMYEQYGRSGSGLESEGVQNSYDTLASELSDLSNEMYYQNYTDERQNQLNAATSMGDLYGTDIANMLSAAGGLSSAYSSERGNQMTAAGLANDLANQDYTDLSQLLGVGTSQQDYAQSLIDAAMSEWEWNQSAPLNSLSALAQLLGTTETTSDTSSNDSWNVDIAKSK